MSFSSVMSWVLCGLAVGLVARYLVPGRQIISPPMTIILGIVGAVAGGIFYSIFWGASAAPFAATNHNWYGWITSILGGMLALWVYPYVYPRKWTL